MSSVVNLKGGFITFNSNIDYSLSFSKCAIGYSNYNIKNPREYTKLCEINNKLPINPKKTYEGQFTTWIEYLSIKRIYYEFEECKKRITELFEIYPEITNNYLDLLDRTARASL